MYVPRGLIDTRRREIIALASCLTLPANMLHEIYGHLTMTPDELSDKIIAFLWRHTVVEPDNIYMIARDLDWTFQVKSSIRSDVKCSDIKCCTPEESFGIHLRITTGRDRWILLPNSSMAICCTSVLRASKPPFKVMFDIRG